MMLELLLSATTVAFDSSPNESIERLTRMKCLHKPLIDKKLIHLIPGVAQVGHGKVTVQVQLYHLVSTCHTELWPIIPELCGLAEWGETPKTSTLVPWSIKLPSRCILILIHPSTIDIMVECRSEGFLNFLTL